jgi:hypothetical protein
MKQNSDINESRIEDEEDDDDFEDEDDDGMDNGITNQTDP